MVSKFNPLFNGEQALLRGETTLREQHKDNFDEILPVYRLGDEQLASNIKPDMEKAIEKGSKVIQEHSMMIRNNQKNKFAPGAKQNPCNQGKKKQVFFSLEVLHETKSDTQTLVLGHIAYHHAKHGKFNSSVSSIAKHLCYSINAVKIALTQLLSAENEVLPATPVDNADPNKEENIALNYADYISTINDLRDNQQTTEILTRDMLAYRVYRDGEFLIETDLNTFSYTDNDTEHDVIYCYTVRTVYDVGESVDSNQSCDEWILMPVTDFDVTGTNGQVDLIWTAANSNNVLGYNVNRDGVLLDFTADSMDIPASNNAKPVDKTDLVDEENRQFNKKGSRPEHKKSSDHPRSDEKI